MKTETKKALSTSDLTVLLVTQINITTGGKKGQTVTKI